MTIKTLFDLAVDPRIDINFSIQDFYDMFVDDEIKSLWNGDTPTSYVIGLIINGTELRYPFEAEEFLTLIKTPWTYKEK